jgi:four helix bundle protein
MAKTHFENLRVYELAEQVSDCVWNIVVNWDTFARNTIGAQIVRSADSIGANLAEGSGRGSDVDYKRFIRISRGSLYETRHWLRRAYKRDLLTREQIDQLTPLLDELTPTLNAYLKSIGTFDRGNGQKDQKPKTKNQANAPA